MSEPRVARTMDAAQRLKLFAMGAERFDAGFEPPCAPYEAEVEAAAIADQDAWAEQVCAPLVEALERFVEGYSDEFADAAATLKRPICICDDGTCGFCGGRAALAAYREGR